MWLRYVLPECIHSWSRFRVSDCVCLCSLSVGAAVCAVEGSADGVWGAGEVDEHTHWRAPAPAPADTTRCRPQASVESVESQSDCLKPLVCSV